MNNWNQEEFEKRFTEPVDAIRKVDQLKSLDLSTKSDDEIKDLINSYFNIIPFTSGTIPAGSELFRARLNQNDQPYNSIEDIYAPPAQVVKGYGRVNKPGERIFYSASNFKLAAVEVIQDFKYSFNPKQEVAFLTIGIWRTMVDLHVASIIHDPKIHELREDIKKDYKSNQDLLFNGMIKNETALASNILLQFFAEEFTKADIKGDYEYKISNFYISSLREANNHIAPQFQSEKFDGIDYPSVAMKYKGNNQALFIDSVDDKLEFTNAIEVICSNMDFDKGDFLLGILHEAESIEEGKIIWKKELYRPN